jgi:glycosyltransferase involved in cell wall biosynthesis
MARNLKDRNSRGPIGPLSEKDGAARLGIFVPAAQQGTTAQPLPVEHIGVLNAAVPMEGVDVPLAAAPPGSEKPAPLRFHLDEVSPTQIAGWIIKPDQPSHRCIVALREGNCVLAQTVASQFRADLAAAGIGDGCHCFVMTLPPILLDQREHLLELIEQDSGLPLTAEPIRWRSEPIPGEAVQTPAVVRTRVLFDISDLVYYVGHHANLTGIQRVQSSIVLSILTNELLPQANLIFVSFNLTTRNLVSIPTGFVISLLEDLFLPESHRLVSFPAAEARYGLLPGWQDFDGAGVLDDGDASVLCLLGAAWVHQDYLFRVLALKRRFGTKFVMTVHDLIAIYARETCDQDTARVFEDFMRRALRHTDHILSVSESTATDIRRYVRSLQIPEPPITVTRNGSSFAEFLPDGGAAGEIGPADVPERFVLFVATVEGRKNHQLMLDIWRRMIADGDDVPHLLCVGRLGWKSSAFLSTLVETDYLGGRVLLLRDISDTDLKMLYGRCLFTVCPTFYEGWGLPIGESLAMGKICVCSDRTSVPEVAGDFGVYIDIANVESSLQTIRGLIASEPARKELEAKIRRDYKPIAWRSVAEKVVAACLAAPKIEWQEPYPYTAIPYSSEISFGRLDRNTDGMGETLLQRIAWARRGVFLSGQLDEQSFLRGEEARSAGYWAQPEEWGTWACFSGGEITLGLAPSEELVYHVFLRLRANGPVFEEAISLLANGETVWQGSLGEHSRDLLLRIRRRTIGASGWLLRIRAHLDLTADLEARLSAIDGRLPTIGFERLIIVPDSDLKTRVDVLGMLFSSASSG